MKSASYSFKEKLWIYKGDSPWHFLTIPKKDAEIIRKEYIWPRRGFGSIRVRATIGKTTWKTSIFPDKEGTYLLPVKKDVRELEHCKAGDIITCTLEVLS